MGTRLQSELLEDILHKAIRSFAIKDSVNKIKVSAAIVRQITNRINWYISEKEVHQPISYYEMAAGIIFWVIKLRPIWEGEEEHIYLNEACAYYAAIGGIPSKGKTNIPKLSSGKLLELFIRLRYCTFTLDSIDALIRCLHPPK
jgi:hypothetical protein